MAILSPTHVVTIGVWSPHDARAANLQAWVTAGPFDSAEDLTEALQDALERLCDATEVIDRRTSTHRGRKAPWEQLSLL